MNEDLEKHIPLTESTYYILLSLTESIHGYGIMQKVNEMSEGTVKLGPGTLYGALGKLKKEGFIEEIADETDSKRKNYVVTDLGKELMEIQHHRLKILYENSAKIFEG
ncbi:PadR family transcriptional regulator [Inconstantimicrobium mannanitabidum]|uniref:PadR family transcriptional regulator n=1 Tax=Inconstantimicrobium mannanitabidum TaxID=1604901 RepID=A0ACB5RHT6_9CLOT|nr:PadR family transcriptional regulator [Clostridium sp. TW13]GKX68632.1 PadR family transcriptional regulator [Clostridium sp. TW13]